MKRMTCSIVLLALLMVAPAMADFTLLVGNGSAQANVGPERLGSFEPIVCFGMDYSTPQSQVFKNFQLDTGDIYVGLGVKIHLTSKDADIDPYVAWKSMSRGMTLQGDDGI